jgi:hypothetical protein
MKLNMKMEVLTLEAEKAFDTVNHDIMFNKLYRMAWKEICEL